jgi:hypothetical protein
MAGRQDVIERPPLDNIRDRSAVDFDVQSNLPAKISGSHNDQTAPG